MVSGNCFVTNRARIWSDVSTDNNMHKLKSWMHCLASSNQCGANSVTVAGCPTKSQPRLLVAWKAAFLENYSAVSAWILNGSSIEWHEKKRQPFSLSGVRFESRTILISGWKSAWRWSSRKWAFHPCLLLITCNNSQRKTHQITQIRQFQPQKIHNNWGRFTFILSFNIVISRCKFTILGHFNISHTFLYFSNIQTDTLFVWAHCGTLSDERRIQNGGLYKHWRRRQGAKAAKPVIRLQTEKRNSLACRVLFYLSLHFQGWLRSRVGAEMNRRPKISRAKTQTSDRHFDCWPSQQWIN